MKVLVAVKRVVDHNIKVHAKADGSGIDINHLKMSMNPFDEVAVEEALRQKESGKVQEVISVSCGVKLCEETLRTSMAMGADRALHVVTDMLLQPLSVAKLLAAVVKREQPQLVLLGKQAIDDDANQVGQMLAALLGWGQATFASKVDLNSHEVVVQREIDGGHEILKLPLPCVVTVDLRLNEPRYIKLPNIITAKKKPLDTLTPELLGIDLAPHFHVHKIEETAPYKQCIIVDNVKALVSILKTKTKVLS